MSVPVVAGEELDRVLRLAAKSALLIGLTFYDRNRWLTLRSRILSIQGGRLGLAQPDKTARQPSETLAVGTEVGVSFRIGQYRYSFTSPVAEIAPLKTEPGEVPAVAVRYPAAMHRTDRRMSPRSEVEGRRSVRVLFWPGGRAAEPAGIRPDRPVWGGAMVDVGPTGFSIRTTWDAGAYLEIGDIIGARVRFEGAPDPVHLNAQLRHALREGSMCVLGFQLVGMDATAEDRAAMKAFADRASELFGPSG